MKNNIIGIFFAMLSSISLASLDECKEVAYYWRDDLSKIRAQCAPLAESGNSQAAYNLYYAISLNIGAINPNDKELKAEAIKWLKISAENGDSTAQVILAMTYEDGSLEILKDQNQALNWYKTAANSGDPSAQFQLGVKYSDGIGVLQNYKSALYWHTKAAFNGNVTSQYNLGIMYAKGEGTAIDLVKSYAWLNISSTEIAGSSRSYAQEDIYRHREARDAVLKQMSKNQIVKGQKLSIELSKRVKHQK